MKKRLSYSQVAPKIFEGFSALGEQLLKAFPDPKLKALVELRVSQINGCGFCIDMHSTEARKLGEKQQRLDCLSVWHEVNFFTPRERAAFAWAEAVTLVAKTRVPDQVYDELTAHFSNEEAVQLTAIIGLMNAWNRFAISFRNEPAERKE